MRIKKIAQSVGLVGTVTEDINDTNDNAVANAKTVKEYVDNKEKKFELWRNPNPTGTIANNVTFTFDSQEDYDELEVLYKRTNTQNYIFSTGRLPKGYNISLDCKGTSADNYALIRSRNLTRVNDYSYTHLYPSIQYTNSNVSTTENGACIPIVIYGYKYEV